MELQGNLETFQRSGVSVCAISYDSVEVLARFAGKFGITYPLLSDAGSEVIRRFGILNTNVPEGHAWHGVPFPGTLMVDRNGVVIEKSFYPNHAVRDSVPRMLSEGFGVTAGNGGPAQTAKTDTVRATARLSSGTFRPGQVLTFAVEIEVKPGFHIQARPLPEGYVPTTLALQGEEGVEYGEVQYPPGRRLRPKLLKETLHVYDGKVVLKAAVRCRRRDPFSVRARLDYQACDDRTCDPPQRIDFEIPVAYLDNVKG